MTSDLFIRIAATIHGWRARFRTTLTSAANTGTGPDQPDLSNLQHRAHEMDANLAKLDAAIAAETQRAQQLEASAKASVNTGNAPRARSAFETYATSINRLQQLDAEATVVRDLLAECRDLIERAGRGQPEQSR